MQKVSSVDSTVTLYIHKCVEVAAAAAADYKGLFFVSKLTVIQEAGYVKDYLNDTDSYMQCWFSSVRQY